MVNNNNIVLSAHHESSMNGNGVTFPTPSSMVRRDSGFFQSLRCRLLAFMDFMWFIIRSIGFIIRGLYYLIVGNPKKDLKTDIALITGGGSGLGRLLAIRLGKMGTKVIIWDINREGINQTIAMVEDVGGFCKGYIVDISKREEVYRAANVVKNEIGDVTLLINNAGVVSGLHLLHTPDHLIERSFHVNVMAHFWTTKAFLPKMIENDRGHIATIASLAGHVGISKLVDYCASKFAAVGFDEALRLELEVLGHKNIRTTCICPFFIRSTGMFDDVNARWASTLNSHDVADRIVCAIQRNELIAIIPGFMRVLLSFKWTFPWGCTAGLLRNLVPDAAPQTHLQLLKKRNAFEEKMTQETTSKRINNSASNDFSETLTKKTNSLLIQRTPSLGERVL